MKSTEQEDISTMSLDDRNFAPADLCIVPVKGKVNSGIVVFSSSLKALYMNEAARELLIRMTRKENERAPGGTLPRSVNELLDEMLPLLRTATMDRGWKQPEARRLFTAPDQSVLVKTFGIHNRLDVRRSLIVLTIQETA